MHITTVEVGLRVHSAALDSTIEGSNSLLITFLTQQDCPQRVVCLCPLWLMGHSLFQILQGGFRVILPCQESTQIKQGKSVIVVNDATVKGGSYYPLTVSPSP